ncbi:MAG TPA: hypothetical protein VGB37_16445 [Candidatus Lokiarchaeia archaeon]
MNWMYWVIILVTGILVAFMISGLIWKRRTKKEKLCNHNFKYEGYFIYKEHPRLLEVCKKCGVSIHIPIYTIRKLREIEDGN